MKILTVGNGVLTDKIVTINNSKHIDKILKKLAVYKVRKPMQNSYSWANNKQYNLKFKSVDNNNDLMIKIVTEKYIGISIGTNAMKMYEIKGEGIDRGFLEGIFARK
ncbi:hypothetical protein PV797_08735 [Clostridiaceae bacterium M8S5]|nr:hypothetical protein PV797_08735 [Clostridiaceae bacterium M8S5]